MKCHFVVLLQEHPTVNTLNSKVWQNLVTYLFWFIHRVLNLGAYTQAARASNIGYFGSKPCPLMFSICGSFILLKLLSFWTSSLWSFYGSSALTSINLLSPLSLLLPTLTILVPIHKICLCIWPKYLYFKVWVWFLYTTYFYRILTLFIRS